MLFSVLIPTLESRQAQFSRLHGQLSQQIADYALGDQVEIISFRDNREHSIGFKRNELVKRAQGHFVAFIDDDDQVSHNYLPLICQAIAANPGLDCLGIKGMITFLGKHPHLFVHSLRYQAYFSRDGVYFRPPYHLNPIKRCIALNYPFANISYSEDIDWAMRLCRDRALQREYFIEQVIYYYYSRRPWLYQALLDQSEPVRHALGLQLANRLRLKRWLAARWQEFSL